MSGWDDNLECNIVWSYFEKTGDNVTCTLCGFLTNRPMNGNPLMLLRHLQKKHAYVEEIAASIASQAKVAFQNVKVEDFSEEKALQIEFSKSVNKSLDWMPSNDRSTRRHSVVWKYFSKIENIIESSDARQERSKKHVAQCNFCSYKSDSNNTTNLLKHLVTHHKPESVFNKQESIVIQDFEEEEPSLSMTVESDSAVELPLSETSSKMRSVVWKYFSKIPNMGETCDKSNDNNSLEARCSLCSGIFVFNTTSNLIRHLRNKHDTVLRSKEGGNSNQSKTDDINDDHSEGAGNKNDDSSIVKRVWTRLCSNRRRSYDEELAEYDQKSSKLKEDILKMQKRLVELHKQRNRCEEQRRKELERQTELQAHFFPKRTKIFTVSPVLDTMPRIQHSIEASKASENGIDRKRSKVWKHFMRLDADLAKCNICKSSISYKGGCISNLKRHLAKKHPAVLDVSTQKQS